MNRINNSLLQRTLFGFTLLAFSISGVSRTALAEQLQPITGASFDGSIITWQALDAAVGYNIYLDFQYLDTVTGVTEYAPGTAGEYRIAAFDANGNFSPLQVIDSDVVPTSNIAIVGAVATYLVPPQNVFGIVYSSSAGEIFWDREVSGDQVYTVTIEGVELGTTDGTSYWLSSLSANAQNIVTVVAGDRTGSMSEVVTLALDTRRTTFPAPAIDADSDVPHGQVAPPLNARLEIYGPTTAELFWNRALPSEGIAITEVYRDNTLIGSSPGNSFYDDTRAPNTLYAYELVAINADGTRSPSTFINPGPFDGDAETIVLSLLTGISEVTNTNPHVEWFPIIQSIRFDDLPEDIVEVSSSSTFDDGVVLTRTEYACSNGSLILESTSGFESTANLIFDQCNTNRVSFFGSVKIFSQGALFETVDYVDLMISDDTDVIINGTVISSKARAADERTITYSSLEYYVVGNLIDEAGLDTAVMLDQTIAFDSDQTSGPSTFTTRFTASAPWTQGRTLTVTTEEAFAAIDPSTGNYTVGSLTAESDNRERLTLSANTSDAETWYAEVTTPDGTQGIVGSWSELIQFPCIVLNGECR